MDGPLISENTKLILEMTSHSCTITSLSTSTQPVDSFQIKWSPEHLLHNSSVDRGTRALPKEGSGN